MKTKNVLLALLLAPWLLGPLQASGEEKRPEPDAVVLLVCLGEPGQVALLAVLDVDHPDLCCHALEAIIEHGNDLAPFVPKAADLLLSSHDPEVARCAGRLLARAGRKGEEALLEHIRTSSRGNRDWAAVEAAAPHLASRLLARIVEEQAPEEQHLGFDIEGLRRTEIVGGGGGKGFEDRCPASGHLVGLRHTTIGWAGHRILRSIQPLYLANGEIREGPVHGRRNGRPAEVRAKPGYAVGGLLVRSGHRVDGFALVFLRIDGDRLDPADSYIGPWSGGRGGGAERLLGGSGLLIAGICGREGADVDAIGLVERAPSSPAAGGHLVRLTFEGRIDGSEQIVINSKEARWENVFWGTSKTSVRLNGVTWDPRKSTVLANRGETEFLPVTVDFSTARLEKTRGRDAVVLLPERGSVTVRIADNPNGTDLYEFSILFEPTGPPAELCIRATVDGSDEILVTAEKATWRHRHWG